MKNRKHIRIPAIKTTQSNKIDLYSFFLPGKDIFEIAQISRIYRSEDNKLEGFQRKEIRNHVKRIVEYLDTENVLFPNAILLAISSDIVFKRSRGRKAQDIAENIHTGILEIPIYSDGDPVAWIVDGQQRSLALSESKKGNIPVPIIAFVSDNVEVQREQFILVNKAKPLPSRLINELLPDVQGITLPRDLAPRRIPSELCNLLNQDSHSPFHGIIRRISTDDEGAGIIVDTALINVIKRSISNPLGALSPYKKNSKDGSADIEKMYFTMCTFWAEVKKAFPDAWGKPPTESRLMHSAGIEAMGFLMDKVMGRIVGHKNPSEGIFIALKRIAPHCRWTGGTWEDIGMAWNEIQNVGKHVRLLADTLMQIDHRAQKES